MLSAALLASALEPVRLLGAPTPPLIVQQPDEPVYVLGDPGKPAKTPTLVIALFDDSGSVIGPSGTDPLSNRYAEVTRAFSTVARKGSRRELGAVLHFDTPCSTDVGPTPLTRRGLRRLQEGLHRPVDIFGTSELGPSLCRARQLADAHPTHTVTLVVLSDFQLLDDDPTRVLLDLETFPGTVHAVVLGGLPPGVLAEPITVTTIDRNLRPGAVARALFSSLVTHRPGSHVQSKP